MKIKMKTGSNEDLFRDAIEQNHTLVIEYDYENGHFYIDPLLNSYIHGDLTEFSPYNFDVLKGIIYRPDMVKLLKLIQPAEDCVTNCQTCELRLFTDKRKYEWFRLVMSTMADEYGKKQRVVVTLNNINTEVTNRIGLQMLAERDPLTMIPNRDTFTKHTEKMLKRFPDQRFVLIYMDLEHFHIANQLFGTEEGDKMLKFTAVQMQECVEACNGTYCRIASDKFAFCVAYEPDEVSAMLNDISSRLKNYPLDYKLTASFGLYVIDNISTQVDTMVSRASHAQRMIVGNYATHYAYYDANLLEKETEEQFILNQMVNALAEDQFRVYLQPKVDMRSGKLSGAEALIRWFHPKRGFIFPSAFIPIFERNGFIMQMDTYAWDKTCAAIRRWLDEGKVVHPISVNVSRVDLYNPKLTEVILSIVRKYNIPMKLLDLELTESAIMSDLDQLTEIIDNLRSHGFRIHMDDFGSGYSSLNALKDIKVDVLKLDMRFLAKSAETDRGSKILKYTIEMAKSIGLEVIAEGIETQEQRERLLSMGCFYGQGYLFGKPVSIDDFYAQWIDNQAES